MDSRLERVIDSIYEAAVIPELWPVVLDQLASEASAIGGALFVAGAEAVKWRASPEIEQLIADFVDEGWMTSPRNTRARRTAAASEPGFLGDLDLFTMDEIKSEPIYTEYLHPRGFGWGAGTLIDAPSRDRIVVTVERKFEQGPLEACLVSRLTSLRPHLARAGLLSCRLSLERARAGAHLLSMVGLPAAVLSGAGRIMAANAEIEALMPDVVIDTPNGIRLLHRGANALLARALKTAVEWYEEVFSIPIPAREGGLPVVAHLVRVRGSAHDLFGSAEAILILTPVGGAVAPSAALIQGLFDLTPAEARIARQLTEGQTVRQIASQTRTAETTVRTHLKALLRKTSLAKQSDLVGLLAGAAFRVGSKSSISERP